jgi:hypothetical protein
MSRRKEDKEKVTHDWDAGRAFKKGIPNTQDVIMGELTEMGDCTPEQRMFFILQLGYSVVGQVNRSKGRGMWGKKDITPEEGEKIWSEENTTNFFNFINNNLSWEETVVLVHLMSKMLEMSFTLFHRNEAWINFATRMKNYILGTI